MSWVSGLLTALGSGSTYSGLASTAGNALMGAAKTGLQAASGGPQLGNIGASIGAKIGSGLGGFEGAMRGVKAGGAAGNAFSQLLPMMAQQLMSQPLGGGRPGPAPQIPGGMRGPSQGESKDPRRNASRFPMNANGFTPRV